MAHAAAWPASGRTRVPWAPLRGSAASKEGALQFFVRVCFWVVRSARLGEMKGRINGQCFENQKNYRIVNNKHYGMEKKNILLDLFCNAKYANLILEISCFIFKIPCCVFGV